MCSGNNEEENVKAPIECDSDFVVEDANSWSVENNLRSSLLSTAPHREPDQVKNPREVKSPDLKAEMELAERSVIPSLADFSLIVTKKTQGDGAIKIPKTVPEFGNERYTAIDDQISMFEKNVPSNDGLSREEIIRTYNIDNRITYSERARPVMMDKNQVIHCTDGTILLDDGTLVGPALEGTEKVYFRVYTANDHFGDIRAIFEEKLKRTEHDLECAPSMSELFGVSK